MLNERLRLLVIEGYTKAGRENLIAGGMTPASELYRSMFQKLAPNAMIDIYTPADPGASLPEGMELDSYHGAAMTGSSLSVLDPESPPVRSQIELQRELFKKGIPSFGSCWALQVGAVVAGGVVDQNPKGREMGFARKVTLTDNGQTHPLYSGKSHVFDAFASHDDEVVVIPEESKILASNAVSDVQSMEIVHGNGVMWALQYHPEYNTSDMASLIRVREEKLIDLGFFENSEEVSRYADKLDLVHEHPTRKDLWWGLGIDADILDEQVRRTEVLNWLRRLVLPNMH